MIMKSRARLAVLLGLLLAIPSPSAVGDVVLLQDNFDSFALGTTWQGTTWQGATGAPDGVLAGGVTQNGAVALRMNSVTGISDWKGIETIAPISLAGMRSITLDVRTTADNINNASPIEVTLLGDSGKWMKFYYTYTAWQNNYLDSDGHTGVLGSWPSGMDPYQYRRWIFQVADGGVAVSVRDKDDVLRWGPTSFSSPSLSGLGSSVDIVLRQNKNLGSNIYVDYVTLTGTVPEPSTLVMAIGIGVTGLLARFWRRKRGR
jgi:hypothetical protein